MKYTIENRSNVDMSGLAFIIDNSLMHALTKSDIEDYLQESISDKEYDVLQNAAECLDEESVIVLH